jgi:hypothetical protein
MEMSPDEISVLVRPLKVTELLQLHGAILEELRERKIVRSSNGPAGDYAELLFSQAFSWVLESNSASGHDAMDGAGQRYQIKSRRITPHNRSRQLSFIRRLPDKTFDFLAGVLFNADYSIYRAVIVPHSIIEPRCRFSKHANGWLFKLEDGVWAIPEARDVTDELKAAAVTLDGAVSR